MATAQLPRVFVPGRVRSTADALTPPEWIDVTERDLRELDLVAGDPVLVEQRDGRHYPARVAFDHTGRVAVRLEDGAMPNMLSVFVRRKP